MSTNVTDCHFNEVEAARYFSKSPRWLQKQIKDSPDPPPSFKLGKSRLFRKSELDAWLERFRSGAPMQEGR
jgi:predicted DNA-binding transcriptional regulator AlpA